MKASLGGVNDPTRAAHGGRGDDEGLPISHGAFRRGGDPCAPETTPNPPTTEQEPV